MALILPRATGPRRLAAAVLDATLSLVLAALLSGTLGRWFAGRAVPALHIGDPDGPWTGGTAMILGAAGDLVYGLPAATALLLLAEPIAGVSPGKAAVGLSIVDPCGVDPSRGRLMIRFLVKAAAAWAPAVGLASGSWSTVVAASGLGAMALVRCLPALMGRPALHDAVSALRVVRPSS